jgi:hypothetical protein
MCRSGTGKLAAGGAGSKADFTGRGHGAPEAGVVEM